MLEQFTQEFYTSSFSAREALDFDSDEVRRPRAKQIGKEVGHQPCSAGLRRQWRPRIASFTKKYYHGVLPKELGRRRDVVEKNVSENCAIA